jgi:hypothetical protein
VVDPFPYTTGQDDRDGEAQHRTEEWAEILARSIAHLAAQLTVTQIRLRALATVLHERGGVDDAAVAERVRQIAASAVAGYLRENLGEAMVELIDVEALERDLLAYLDETAAEPPAVAGPEG